MKKIIPLIFSVLYVISSNAQAVGGWGTCEFANVATMNAFDPSTNAYDCKKVFVQATNEHYYWNGTAWVLVQDTNTDDQNASEVPFTPVGTIVATDVQAAIAEIEPDIYGSIGVHSDVDVTTTAPSNGDVLSWDGTNFVPVSASGSSDNIYNIDGTIDANREVSLGNFDLEFNSTGTGDFFVSDNGTIVLAVEDDHVGIGLASPTKPLHIYETTGTPASATNGTIFLEKGDSGGSQSIVFESNVNAGSDYGYIEYSDDGSGNGSTTENSLLVIGTENDAAGIYQDDIAIMPSGYLGVGTISPDAFFDVEGGQVRFSNYGSGIYDDASPVRILGVQADGDIIEVDPATLGGGSSSSAIGTIYIGSGDQVETTLTEDVPKKASGTTTLINATDVDMPTNNRLRYTGSSTQTFFVSCNISVQVDGNNRQIYYSIRKNGVNIPSIKSAKHNSNTNSSSELNSTTITGTVELSTNDYLELWIENIETGHDVTVWFMNFTMMSASGGGGSGGSGDNIYTANGTLAGARTLSMDGNNLTFSDTGAGEKVQIGTFGGNGGGKLQVDISDGDALVQGIKTVVQQTTGTNYAINGTAQGAGATTNTGLYGWASGATNNRGLWVNSGFGIFDDKVGIGLLDPGAQLEVTYDRDQTFTVAEPDDGINTFLSSIVAINTNAADWSRALTSLTPNIADGNKSGLLTFGQGDATRQAGHMYFVDTGADGDEYIGFGIRNGSADILNITGGGNVGIGTTSPDALLDVEGGTVRFSDYGAGTNSGTTTYVLGVDVDGDVIEIDPSSLGGSGGGGSNIYTANGTLGANRTVTMNGNDLTFDSGASSNFTIDGFTGSTFNNPIFQLDRNAGRDFRFFHKNDSNSGYWTIGTNDGIALEVDNIDGEGIYIEHTGDVGIGTSTPDRKLDVEGGQVRFSDYGTGTYEDTTAVYLLGVEADGDLIEMNTAKNSRIFYPPSIAIVADAIATNLTLDLHQTYVDLFDSPAVKSTSAPGAVPTYAQDELYYYILDYDTDVFENVTIDNNGLMEYDVKAVASDNCSFINILFVIKEP